jgi:nicotinamidase-related amidase
LNKHTSKAHHPPLSTANTSSYHSAKASSQNQQNNAPTAHHLTPYIKPQASKNQSQTSEYAQQQAKLKFDLYKYQKTGMTRLNVEHMAQQRGVQLQAITE